MSVKDRFDQFKKKIVAYSIRESVNNTFGRGIYFGWKDKLLVLFILALFFGAILLFIIYYPYH